MDNSNKPGYGGGLRNPMEETQELSLLSSRKLTYSDASIFTIYKRYQIRDGDTVQVYTDDGRPVYFDSFGLFLLRVEEVYNDRHPLRHVLDPAPH